MDPSPLGASDAPAEILQHIFVLDADSCRAFELRPGAKHPALRLAHVSRAWRAAALGTSVLWSRLKVNISPGITKTWANGNAASWRSALDQFLVLAQNFRLRISLMCSGMSRWRTDDEIQDIAAALFHTAPRWKSLSLVFRVDEKSGDSSFLDPLRDKLDSLEELKIMVFNYGSGIPFRCTTFRDAPKLTKVCIAPDNVILVELPWSRLLHVDFIFNGRGDKAQTRHDFLVGLQQADRLKTIQCREYDVHRDAPIMDQPVAVELPCLEEITLFASSPLVHRLVLPSLSKLHVHESQSGDLLLSPHLIQSLVARSKCNIISLTISEALALQIVDGLRDIARHLPHLVTLGLEQIRPNRLGCDLSHGVFSLLTSSHTAGYLFPLLQHISLSTHVEGLKPDDLFRVFPSLSALLASRNSVATRVYTHARVYQLTRVQNIDSNGRVQLPYHRYAEVEDDPRWQAVTGGYRGQMNVLIRVIGTSMYDYQVWLGRTPEPEVF